MLKLWCEWAVRLISFPVLSTDQVYLPYVLLRSFGDHFFGLLINANILVLDMDCLNEIIPMIVLNLKIDIMIKGHFISFTG